MISTTVAALHPVLNALVMTLGLVCVLGLFLLLTQYIEHLLRDEGNDDRSGS